VNILVVSDEYPPIMGGISSFSFGLVKGLQQTGHQLRVVTAFGPPGRHLENGIGVIRSSRLHKWRLLREPPFLLAVFLAAVKQRPDVIFCTKLSRGGVMCWLLHQLFRIPYVLLIHGSELTNHSAHPLLGRIVRKLINDAQWIVTNSRFTVDLVTKHVGPGLNPTVIHPPLDSEAFNLHPDTRDLDERFGLRGKRVLLTVGHLVERKGHLEVIKALDAIKDRYPDLVYVIAGGAGTIRPSLEELAANLGLSQRVIFTGFVERQDLEKLYARTEIFVMPSRIAGDDVEGFGIAYQEANLYGKPVIGGNSGGVSEAVIDGETGILVEPQDIAQIIGALTALLDDATLRRKLGEAGRQRVLNDLSIKGQVQKLEHVLQESCRNGKTNPLPELAERSPDGPNRWRRSLSSKH